ncbi:amidase [Hirsutella rhossiliensis]|uniref:Amidase domain-containing protein n=1 Tax=Hirsutella rhossiliensis TaxID=111463 RepID=A0A9P8MRB9_9HYPO|nr:amidase domain-containing protein [Hirsutella rhossiliensis]KAH0959860.1 amidase domain-containing protein [Hirsutella rhossiliensis]
MRASILASQVIYIAYTTLSVYAAPPDASSKFPPLLDATLDQLRQGLDGGAFTSVDLVNAYVARINEVNSALRPVAEINPEALAIATQLDSERRSNGQATASKPLHGIPILIKDNIATCDLMNNTAGSYALLGAKVPEDSTVAAKLRKAGAIILGKANLSQWANHRSLNTSNGWSAYGGQTVAAYYPGQDPSGSSSGSGVASSIGLAWASLGTETDGSILSPAQISNIVGIKPSVGLTSRYLVIPISEHQDTIGPMARTVKDAAHLLSAIAGPDGKDNYTSAFPFRSVPDYAKACTNDGLKGKRLGIPRKLTDGNGTDPTAAAFQSALKVLREAGAEIVDNLTFPGLDVLNEKYPNAEDVVLRTDFVSNLKEYLSHLVSNPNNITSLEDLQAFTQASPKEYWPERDTGIWNETLARGLNKTSPEAYSNETTIRYLAGQLGLTGALKNYTLDAIVLPTDFIINVAALLGTPVVTVPLGKMPANTSFTKNSVGNLNETGPNKPFGIGFAGDKWTEEALIGMAYAFEQRMQVRTTIKLFIQPRTELKDVVKKQ